LGLSPETKVAAAAALHDGLAACQLEVIAEPRDHGVIPAAMDEGTEILQAELLEEFRVPPPPVSVHRRTFPGKP
jgi:hypothetical protein